MKLNKFAYLHAKPLGNHTLTIMKKIPGNLLKKRGKIGGISWNFVSPRKSGNPGPKLYEGQVPRNLDKSGKITQNTRMYSSSTHTDWTVDRTVARGGGGLPDKDPIPPTETPHRQIPLPHPGTRHGQRPPWTGLKTLPCRNFVAGGN